MDYVLAESKYIKIVMLYTCWEKECDRVQAEEVPFNSANMTNKSHNDLSSVLIDCKTS